MISASPNFRAHKFSSRSDDWLKGIATAREEWADFFVVLLCCLQSRWWIGDRAKETTTEVKKEPTTSN